MPLTPFPSLEYSIPPNTTLVCPSCSGQEMVSSSSYIYIRKLMHRYSIKDDWVVAHSGTERWLKVDKIIQMNVDAIVTPVV